MKKICSESEIQPWPKSQQRELTTAVVWMLPNTATVVTSVMKKLCCLEKGCIPSLSIQRNDTIFGIERENMNKK